MKTIIHFPILVLSIISLCTITSGCKSRADREAEKAEERQKKQDSERAVEAQKELTVQTALYDGVSGSFEGSYYDANEVEHSIVVSMVTENKLPEYNSDHKQRESDLVSQKSSLSLSISIVDKIPSEYYQKSSRRILDPIRCSVKNIKPDFAAGTISVACNVDGGTRNYEFSFDASEPMYDYINMKEAELKERSVQIASQLTRNQIRTVDAFHVKITTSNHFETLGWLDRKAD